MAYVGLNSIVPMLGVNPTILWLPNIVIILASAVIYISCHTHNWQPSSPVASPPVGLRSVKYLFIAAAVSFVRVMCRVTLERRPGVMACSLQLPRHYTSSRLEMENAPPNKNMGKIVIFLFRDPISRPLTNTVLTTHLASVEIDSSM